MHPVSLIVSLACALAYAVYLNGRSAVRFSLRFMLPMMLIAAVTNPTFNHEGATILTYLPSGNPLTLESILYGLAAVFTALAFGKRLFAHYNIWVDNAGRVLLTLVKSFLLFLGLTAVLSLLLPMAVIEEMVNPNNEALMSLTGTDFRVTHALAIFIAPIVEETLFRGVVFGTLRPKYPFAAYAVTCLVFAGAHLWQFVGQDAMLWLYLLEYLHWFLP